MIPIVDGFMFGVEFIGGILIGTTIVAIPRAIFIGNSGGAFDNAKKSSTGYAGECCVSNKPSSV